MKILLIGETGTGKTYTSLTLSKFFNTIYIDTENGTELWLKNYFKFDKERFKLVLVDSWYSYKTVDSKISESKLIVLDSLSALQDHYVDYVQQYVRERREFPMPTATGIVKLRYDTEFIVLPMQLYQLVYDTMLNVIDSLARRAEHLIVTMHPIETKVATLDGQVVQSRGSQRYVQAICRRMDIILSYTEPMRAKVVKARGFLDLPEFVNPIDFLKQVLNVNE